MSLERYQQALVVVNVGANEKVWFPKWVAGYAADARVKPRIGGDGLIPVEFDLVIGFLQQLRDTRAQAWRRLQATRANLDDSRRPEQGRARCCRNSANASSEVRTVLALESKKSDRSSGTDSVCSFRPTRL